MARPPVVVARRYAAEAVWSTSAGAARIWSVRAWYEGSATCSACTVTRASEARVAMSEMVPRLSKVRTGPPVTSTSCFGPSIGAIAAMRSARPDSVASVR